MVILGVAGVWKSTAVKNRNFSEHMKGKLEGDKIKLYKFRYEGNNGIISKTYRFYNRYKNR